MVVTVAKKEIDVKCKIPHALVVGTNSICVECAKGIVNLRKISNQVGDCSYIDGKDYQKLLFPLLKWDEFARAVEGSTIIYHRPNLFECIERAKRDEHRRVEIAERRKAENVANAEREAVIEEKKRKIAEKFEAERDTCLIAGHLPVFQNDGVIFMQLKKRVILADQMGLGKTVEAIEFLLREKRDGLFAKALIVLPATLKRQWKDEIERFSGSRLSVAIVDGVASRRKVQWQSPVNVIIVNYDILPVDIANGFLDGLFFSHMIIDEASYIKNYKAKRTVAVKKIGKCVRSRIALTGTPIENDLDELWSIADFVDPGIFGSRDAFKIKYRTLHGTVPKRKLYYGGHRHTDEEYRRMKIGELRTRLKEVMIRRRKDDVLDQLPPLTRMRETVVLDRKVQEVHDAMYEDMTDLIRELARLMKRYDEHNQEVIQRVNRLSRMILAKFVFLRELCLMPELVIPDGDVSNVKLARLKEVIGELSGGDKVIVFTEFRRVALMLHKEIPGSMVVHGKIDKMKRPDIINEFKNSPDKNVLISTSVLTYGVNLQFANYVINYDLHFNPAKMAQRVDRLHRMGQSRNVTVINLVAENSIEERIEQILVRKHDMFCSVIEGKDVDADFFDKSLIRLLVEVTGVA